MSCLLSLLRLMTDVHFQRLVENFQSKEEVKVSFLLVLLPSSRGSCSQSECFESEEVTPTIVLKVSSLDLLVSSLSSSTSCPYPLLLPPPSLSFLLLLHPPPPPPPRCSSSCSPPGVPAEDPLCLQEPDEAQHFPPRLERDAAPDQQVRHSDSDNHTAPHTQHTQHHTKHTTQHTLTSVTLCLCSIILTTTQCLSPALHKNFTEAEFDFKVSVCE